MLICTPLEKEFEEKRKTLIRGKGGRRRGGVWSTCIHDIIQPIHDFEEHVPCPAKHIYNQIQTTTSFHLRYFVPGVVVEPSTCLVSGLMCPNIRKRRKFVKQ